MDALNNACAVLYDRMEQSDIYRRLFTAAVTKASEIIISWDGSVGAARAAGGISAVTRQVIEDIIAQNPDASTNLGSKLIPLTPAAYLRMRDYLVAQEAREIAVQYNLKNQVSSRP